MPASSTEYEAFVAEQIAEFADQKVRAGHWQPDDAAVLSQHAVEGFLRPSGPREGHRVWVALDGTGGRVGWVWVGPSPVKAQDVPTRRWLYQITVDPARRSQGYGRAMLTAIEASLAKDGVRELYLNVFRWNTVARSLYDSSGYEVVYDGETETGMKKKLGPLEG